MKYDLGDRQSTTSTGFINRATRAGIESAELGAFGVELGAGAGEHIGADPVAAELIVVGRGTLLEGASVAAIGLHAGHLPLLAGGQGYLGHEGVLVLVDHQGLLHGLHPVGGGGFGGQSEGIGSHGAAGGGQCESESAFHTVQRSLENRVVGSSTGMYSVWSRPASST